MVTDLKSVRQRKYLARDFDGLRGLLLEYARTHYPDRIRDFSESSLGGLFLDFASYVGDSLSFYLDHQFNELDHENAVENVNIERSLRTAGVPIVGAAPAIVPVTIYVQIPALSTNNTIVPDVDAIPIVQNGSVLGADNGVFFILLEDVDFTKKKSDNTYFASIKVGQKNSDGVPQTFVMALTGLCISGQETTETLSVGRTFVPFRKMTLANPHVSEIVSVTDGFGNTYYHVSALTHDVVYKNVLNTASDNDIVKDAMKIVSAPYRFTTETDIDSRRTTLIFGGGNANTLEDDIIPDPSEFAISFPYSKTFSRLAINPQQLLQTKTLGVASVDTTVTVTYRHGGGLHHSVEENSVRSVISLKMFFPNNPSPAIAGQVRSSIEITNLIKARGGEDAPSVEDLKLLIPAIKNSQERIVTRPDVLARVYSLPSNFGRVFRASIRSNPNNPLASQLFIISRDPQGKLITSSDTLKKNLVKFLNPYRMLSDAIDILDARVINILVNFNVLIDPSLNKSVVLQNILTKLQTTFNIRNYHIDMPIVISDINNAIFTVPGVLSINNIDVQNISGRYQNRIYSNVVYDIAANTRQGIIFPPGGGIFEVKYPEVNIIGKT